MAAAPEACPWQRHWDDTGTVFYYNENTEESEWDVPPGWEAHFAGLDEKASGGVDGGANGDADDRDGGAGEADKAGDVTGADQRQVDDAEGAQALLGLAQVSSGGQGEEDFVAVSPPGSPGGKEEKREGGEGGEGSRAGSSAEGTPAAAAAAGGDGATAAAKESDRQTGTQEDKGAPAAGGAAAATCPWIQSQDEESGDVFYYNEVTEESSWDEPAEYTKFHAAAGTAAAATAAAATPAAADSDDDSEQEYFPQSPAGPVEKGEEGRLNLSPAVAGASTAGGYREDHGTPSPHYSPEDEEEEEEARSSSPRSPSPSRADGSSTAARRTRSSSKDQRGQSKKASPSPELGLSFPAFGDDYSPNHDAEWQVNEEEELERGKNSASPNDDSGAATPLGVSMSPESETSAVGGLSPVVEGAGGAAAGGDGQKQGLRKAGGKGKESSVEDGKPQYSEEEMAKMVKSAESKIAECERRVSSRWCCVLPRQQSRVFLREYFRTSDMRHFKPERLDHKIFVLCVVESMLIRHSMTGGGAEKEWS